MKRRRFLFSTAVGTTALALGPKFRGAPAVVSPEARRDRPNILFVFTDQQQPEALGCAGMPGLRTPAMDSLAGRGVRFARTYSVQPLCVPCRTSLMTGRLPRHFGTRVNNREPGLPAGTPTLGRLLANAGYDTAYTGKWHLPIDEKDTALHGFAEMHSHGEGAKDAVVAPACAEFLRAPRTRPFLLVASIVNPHDACSLARGGPLPNGDLPPAPPPDECPPLPANHALAPDEPAALARAKQLAPQVYPTAGWDEARWRQYLWGYHRLVEKADALVGRILDALATSGRDRDTLVIFSSDHGEGGGAHCWNQKSVLYEESARVPLIVAGPGGAGGGRVDGTHLISHGLDLLPTLCDYAGAPVPAGCQGRSFRPLFEGRAPATPWRDHVIAETEFHGAKSNESTGIRGRLVRTDRLKYIVYSEGANREQLFDLAADPGETRNLARHAAHAAELQRHRALLATWAGRTQDDFPLAG